MLGYKPIKKKLRAIATSTTALIEGTSLMLLIPTKSHTHNELLKVVDQLVTQITIVYADLCGVSSEIIPFANHLVIPFYAKNLFEKPEYNTGSNVYSGDILDQAVTGWFLVNNPGGGSIYNLYFEITLGS